MILKSGIATVDQAMLSTLNLSISIILIKTTSKAEFGYYSLALPISLFLISIQNAIINTPLAVLLITKKGGDRLQYAASLCYGQFFAILPAVFIGLVAIGLLRFWNLDSTQASVAAALCLATVGLLFREFLRAYFFAKETPLRVLKLDALYAILLLGLIALGYLFLTISVPTVFVLMGVSALLVALLFSRELGWHCHPKSVTESYCENWKFGKWALLGVLVTHIQNYSYVYLLGVLLTSVAVADVSAARLLLVPLVFVESGWGKIVVPHGSRLREEGQIALFFKEQILVSLVLALCVMAYTVLLCTFSGIIQNFLFTEKYANSLDYVLFWGMIFAIRFISLNASYGLQVTKNFHTISKVNFVTMLVTVGSAYFLIKSHGPKGGLMALILGGALLAVVLWYCFGKTVFFQMRGLANDKFREKIPLKISKRGPVTLFDD